MLADLEKKKKARAELKVSLTPTKEEAFNVVARLPAGVAESERLPGVVVLGAHYDHLGMAGATRWRPKARASRGRRRQRLGDRGAAGGRALPRIATTSELRRDVVFTSFSGEESGVLGSTHYTRTPSPG